MNFNVWFVCTPVLIQSSVSETNHIKGGLKQWEVIQLRNSGNKDKQIKITEVICHGFFTAYQLV